MYVVSSSILPRFINIYDIKKILNKRSTSSF